MFSAAVRVGMSEADINEAWQDPGSEVLAGDMDTERWWTLNGR